MPVAVNFGLGPDANSITVHQECRRAMLVRVNLGRCRMCPVAENGTVWLTEAALGQRIIPFICQHLAVLVEASTIVPTMHEAYSVIGKGDYGFGVFIGGPSKTADIEQSLVLGAHGPLSMTVFIESGS